MNEIGTTVRRLRQSKGITQEQLADGLHISAQAVSKWECGAAMPDVALLPALADTFGVSIDELFGHRRGAYTEKERLLRLMCASGVLTFPENTGHPFRLNTERFTTNAQIAKIGGCFADCIRENNLAPDMIFGLAYHGIAFSSAAAFALYEKYGVTVHYGHDRMVPDSRGRRICGYTPQENDRVVIVDDLIHTGRNLSERIDRLLETTALQIAGIVVIADVHPDPGARQIEARYGTKVYPILTADDIAAARQNGVIPAE